MMIDFSYDDGGRAEAGYRGDSGDCVVRAIAIVGRENYRRVYRAMAGAMRQNGYVGSGNAYRQKLRAGPIRRGGPSAATVQDMVIQQFGFSKVRLPKGPRPTYSEAHQTHGDCIVTTARHVAALVDGGLRDTFDGRTYEQSRFYCRGCQDNLLMPEPLYAERGKRFRGSGFDRCFACQYPKQGSYYLVTKERKAQSIWVRKETAQ